MITNELLKESLSAVLPEHEAEFDLSYGIAERLDAILKEKGISQHDLASKLGKRDSEVSKWLTGRHNFTIETIAKIEVAIGERIVKVTR